MCGILGYFGNNVESFYNSVSLDLIEHRGPDFKDFVKGNHYYLGQTRLSILDLSVHGNQPMFSKDRKHVIIFNGEIYNHLDLRKDLLSDVSFISTSDTETLLYGLIKFGEKFLNKLNGIFAFSFFNLETNDFLIARDHFGVKPLYYYLSEEEIYFSSELKAISPYLKEKSVDSNTLKKYVNFLWSPGEDTPFKQIKKLLPGHFIKGNSLQLKNIIKVKYYSIPFIGEYLENTEKELVDLLDKILLKAVKRQMLSDVPIGFFLSGGLDSSLIVAMAKSMYPDKSFECYTIDTNLKDTEGFTDDLHYAKLVAKHLDVNLNIVNANIDILESFDKVIYHLDEPQADAAPINVYNICKEARKDGIKVLIGGTAGDDLFSGYRRHQALKIEKYFSNIPKSFRKGIKKVISNLDKRTSIGRRLNKLAANLEKDNEERLMGYFSWLEEKRLKGLFRDNKDLDLFKYFKDLNKLIPNEISPLNKMLFWELNTFLVDHNLNYTDKLSMAVGVEVRVPFLDKELVEFSTKIPPNLKLKGKETKYILKKVAERYLPKEVIYRPKTGFGAPVREWITNDMENLINDYLSEENIKNRGYLNYDKVVELIDDNKKGKIDASYPIWSLLAIESWMRQFVDKD